MMNSDCDFADQTRVTHGALRIALGLLAAFVLVLPACRDNDGKGAPQNGEAAHAEDEHAGHDHGGEEHSDEVTLVPDAIERYGIKVEQASRCKLRPTFLAPARVSFNAEAMAHVGSPLPGRVVELRAKLGDIVSKGDALLIVESPELGEAQSEFLQKRIIAQTTVAAVELAKNALERASRLFDENRGIALDEVQKREVEYKSAQAILQTAQSAAVAAENKLHLLGIDQASVEKLAETGEVNPRFTIVAPLPGRVVEREVTLGELVSPEKESLIVLADTTTLWVLADVPEARLPEVVIGAAAWLKSGSANGHKHEGQVSYISPMVDPRTRSAEVRIAVQCEHGTLWPGMFVQVEITATDQANPDPPPVVAIPEDAIQTVEAAASVFVPVANEPNTFARRAITIGKPVAGLVPVYSGLVEGESFVAAGSFILKAELGKAAAEHSH
ncbi:MAG: Cobalt-zinc-cadmium resistance protein CzcB [Phycisphaerae bacterium]|nr:Cobalt-zinc-cadmium resistance protein CzcB [Phycisphaerae bacterium]